MTKRATALSALLTALSIMTLSACSSEEPINIDLALTKTEANTNNAETAVITYETTAAAASEEIEDSEEIEEYIPEETQPPLPEIPPDKRIPYEGIELDISDAVKVNEYGDAVYDFSYIRYGTDFYIDSNNFELDYSSVPTLKNIEYIKVEKGQEILGGLKITNAELWLGDNTHGYSEIVRSNIELEGSVTWEGLLWFDGDDAPIFGDVVEFAADPSKNDRIPIGIGDYHDPLWYFGDDFAFIMDSDSFFVGSIKEMDADVESALRERGCIRVRAELTDISLACLGRASGYNRSRATLTNVEILK